MDVWSLRLSFPNKGVAEVMGETPANVKVKGVLPGQEVSIRILKTKHGNPEGRLLEVLQKSPVEVDSDCPHFEVCGGCSYRTLPYEEQLRLKEKQVKELLGADYDREVPPVGRLFLKDDIINFGSHHLTVIATPGHTAGSVTFYCKEEEVAFTGDTLFRMSIGRTDLGGNWNDMMQSLHRLAQLPASTKVYPGHEGTTTIGDERQYNPHMRGC